MTRLFLTLVGGLYLGLGLWCAVAPEVTSQKVGFELKPGSGQSEFLTVYGGLEVGLALVFLLPWWDQSATRFSLMACLAIHAALVLFRTIGFFSFTNLAPMTYQLAIGEWIIFLLTAALMIFAREGTSGL